ncbi:MAG: hypothetical protein L3K13_00780 [Thermoplasmata archaeon]|nr:hypothetical protein [Thermoplasmata archaeon]
MRSRARSLDPPILSLLLVILFLLATAPGLPSPPSATSSTLVSGPAHLLAHPAAASPCGASAASGFSGTLREYGSLPPVPTVGGVALEYAYELETTFTPTGKGGPQVTCAPASQRATTNSSGGFALTVTLPTGGCTSHGCTSYAGPFGNTSFTSVGAPPAGYFVHGNVTQGVANVAIAVAYTTLVVSPPGPVLLSANAPSRFSAHPLAADGSPSPVPFAFAWQLASAGWSLTTPPSGSSVLVEAQPGAGPALLGLSVNGSYGGVPFSGVVHLSVLAASTTIGSVLVAPTPVDVGGPVEFSLTGAGAPGYTYTAAFDPGKGLALLPATCSAIGAPDEELSIRCSANGSYASAGPELPSASLTNGYSNATLPLGPLRVNPTLLLSLSPRPLATYLGDPLALSVTVANGTGSAPYGPVCVRTGFGVPLCSSAPGPSWSFAVPYPHPGSYALSATVSDAANTSGQASGTVVVANRPSLGELAYAGGPPTQGASIELSSLLAGGVGPVAYWWNATSPAQSFATGELPASGTVNATFRPSEAGWVTVTLTCVDALGSRVARTLDFYISAGPPVNLAQANGASVPALGEAGIPIPYAIVAMSPENERVASYTRPLTLFVRAPSPSDPVVLYVAALAQTVRPVAGAFALSSSAWYGGYLNFTLEVERSGVYWVSFTAGLPLSFAANGTFALSVGPDPYSLALSSPVVRLAGARANATEYRLADRFGNPGAPGSIWVESVFGSTVANRSAPVLASATGSVVWVNYSAPTSGGGTVNVWSSSGVRLLAAIAVPPASTSTDPTLPLAVGSLVGLLALGGGVLWVRRSRTNRPGSDGGGSAEVTEEELRRTAAGRERLLERIRAEAPVSLERLRAGWPDPRPEPAEVADWLASLLTEGVVLSSVGPGGEPLYRPAQVVDAIVPRVELDNEALERALAREEASVTGEDGPPPPKG